MKKWLFLCLILSSCSPKVVNFTSPNAPFVSYNTFGIAHFKSHPINSTTEGEKILSQIESGIVQEMSRRQYKPQSKKPDLVVRYELISSQRVQNTQVVDNIYTYNVPIHNPQRILQDYALLIEIIDPSKSKTIWQASVELRKFGTKKKREDTIEEAVIMLFNTYLHKAGDQKEYPELDLSQNK